MKITITMETMMIKCLSVGDLKLAADIAWNGFGIEDEDEDYDEEYDD